jgi:hypothetical protein
MLQCLHIYNGGGGGSRRSSGGNNTSAMTDYVLIGPIGTFFIPKLNVSIFLKNDLLRITMYTMSCVYVSPPTREFSIWVTANELNYLILLTLFWGFPGWKKLWLYFRVCLRLIFIDFLINAIRGGSKRWKSCCYIQLLPDYHEEEGRCVWMTLN